MNSNLKPDPIMKKMFGSENLNATESEQGARQAKANLQIEPQGDKNHSFKGRSG